MHANELTKFSNEPNFTMIFVDEDCKEHVEITQPWELDSLIVNDNGQEVTHDCGLALKILNNLEKNYVVKNLNISIMRIDNEPTNDAIKKLIASMFTMLAFRNEFENISVKNLSIVDL